MENYFEMKTEYLILLVWRLNTTIISQQSQQLQINYTDSTVHGTNMGPIWGRQDPGGAHVSLMNFAIWVYALRYRPGCFRVIYNISGFCVKQWTKITNRNKKAGLTCVL